MECHCRRGSRNDLLKGIYQSCNTYFANTYKKIINKYDTPDKGVNQWNSHLKSFGLGNYLGYDLSVGKKGFIPNASYYNSWYKEGARAIETRWAPGSDSGRCLRMQHKKTGARQGCTAVL